MYLGVSFSILNTMDNQNSSPSNPFQPTTPASSPSMPSSPQPVGSSNQGMNNTPTSSPAQPTPSPLGAGYIPPHEPSSDSPDHPVVPHITEDDGSKPKINPTLALIMLGILVVGIMLGYLIGRSSSPKAVATVPTPAPASPTIEVELPMQPDATDSAEVGRLAIRTYTDGQRFRVDLPQSANCDNNSCVTQTATEFIVESNAAAAQTESDPQAGTTVMETTSVDDWRFTLFIGEPAEPVLPGNSVDQLSNMEAGTTEMVEGPDTTYSLTRLDDLQIAGVPAKQFEMNYSANGMAKTWLAQFEQNGVMYTLRYEWTSEVYDMVPAQIATSFDFSVPTAEELSGQEAQSYPAMEGQDQGAGAEGLPGGVPGGGPDATLDSQGQGTTQSDTQTPPGQGAAQSGMAQ